MAHAVAFLYLHPPSRITSTPSPRNQSCHLSSNLGSFASRKSSATSIFHSSSNGSTSGRFIANSQQGNGCGEANPSRPMGSNWSNQLTTFTSQNFLPIALITGVALGLANPTLGCLAHSYNLSKVSTFGIFIISGLTLCSDEIGAATEAWPVGIFGLVLPGLQIQYFIVVYEHMLRAVQFFCFNLILLPINFENRFATSAPTTRICNRACHILLYAYYTVQWSCHHSASRGNSALALAMTVISNLLGILIVPFSISTLIAGGLGLTFPTESLLRSLIVTLMVPLVVGKVAREGIPALASAVDANRKALSIISAILLSFVPWIQISKSRSLILSVKPTTFLIAVFMGGLLHVLLLCFNYFAIPALSLLSGGNKSPFAKEENTIALVLVASQKTLPVMIAVVEQLGGSLGEPGLLLLPCVAAHLNQIILDSFLVSLWKHPERRMTNSKTV